MSHHQNPDHSREELSLIGQLIKNEALSLKIIESLTHKPEKRYRLILTKSINNSIYQIMQANLAANQQQAFQFGLVDETNPATAVTGTYTNGAVTSDTPAVATGNVDSTGNVNFVAVGPGTANLSASALAAFTDSTGAPQSQQLSTDPIVVTVTAVVTADGVKLVLVPGAITQQAAPVPPVAAP